MALADQLPSFSHAQTVRLSSLGCGLITLGLSAVRFVLEGPPSAVGWLLVGVSTALFAAPLLLQTTRPWLAGVTVPAIGLVGTVGMALLEAGALSEALYFLVMVPLAAAFLSGPGAAIMFGLGAQVGLGTVALVAGWGPMGPSGEPSPELLHLFGASGAAGFSALLGWAYETNRRNVDQQRTRLMLNMEQAQVALVGGQEALGPPTTYLSWD